MKSILSILIIVTATINMANAQLPDVFEIDVTCSTSSEGFYDGMYIKSQTTSNFIDAFDSQCGCWDKEGSDDVLVVRQISGGFAMAHILNASGGCAGATSSGSGILGLINPNSTCILEEFTDNSFLDVQGCSLVSITPAPDPIPTLSQWALMILGLILTSIAVVRIRKVAVA